ncbi:MAG: response regulator [Cyanobacteria bacterium HKST-UBA02]|nr:response regulator [Cyanobacteria bacterium HKST-UBA02]
MTKRANRLSFYANSKAAPSLRTGCVLVALAGRIDSEIVEAEAMQNLTAFVLDPDTCLQSALLNAELPDITLCPTASADQLSDSLKTGRADLIILDLQLPDMTGIELVAELRKRNPDIPVILLSAKTPSEEDWISAAYEPHLEVIQAPVTVGKLRYHLSRLFKRGSALADQRRHEIDVAPVEDLRNDKGRLDAELISKMFDLNMTELASNVGITRQALSKTPDSLSIQPALRDFERIARSLLLVTGSGKGLRMWLNSPNEKFDDHTPLEILKLGKVRLLADWIDDARLGNPD